VFENIVLKRIFGPKRDEKMGDRITGGLDFFHHLGNREHDVSGTGSVSVFR
jgi:hypothetical protein